MEPLTGIEPASSSVQDCCSTNVSATGTRVVVSSCTVTFTESSIAGWILRRGGVGGPDANQSSHLGRTRVTRESSGERGPLRQEKDSTNTKASTYHYQYWPNIGQTRYREPVNLVIGSHIEPFAKFCHFVLLVVGIEPIHYLLFLLCARRFDYTNCAAFFGTATGFGLGWLSGCEDGALSIGGAIGLPCSSRVGLRAPFVNTWLGSVS